MKILYCDNCKRDERTWGDFHPDEGPSKKVGDPCENCGCEIFEANSYDEMP